MSKPNLGLFATLCVLLQTAITLSCGPGEAAPDCVSVDEQLGVPAARAWCGGDFFAQREEENYADKELPVCLPPLPNGECELCPTDKVVADVEHELLGNLEVYRPGCELDHWEFGCMRTIENAMTELGRETDYCCYQVALWGDGCIDPGG